MKVLEPIIKRRAFRAFSEKQIPEDILENIAIAGTLAPSCANAQPWRLITVTQKEKLDKLKEALTPGNYWAKKAPAITAVVTKLDWDARLDNGRDYAFFDTGMAVMNYQLQAIEHGLYAHPIAGFDAVKAKDVLEIPTDATLLTLVILGYPGDHSHLNEKHLEAEKSQRTRKALHEVYALDSWQTQLSPPSK